MAIKKPGKRPFAPWLQENDVLNKDNSTVALPIYC